MSIDAAHPGICPSCGGAIRVGMRIAQDPELRKWVHEVCPQDVPKPVCPHCWTVISRSGACMCEEVK